MTECQSDPGAQCWICPQCHNDKHHVPGDERCLKHQIKNLTLANRDLQDWFDDARDEAKRLRGRVAQLESAVPWTIYGDNLTATVLRKQAEAVERLEDFKYVCFGTTGVAIDILDITNEVRRLRQAADEADK